MDARIDMDITAAALASYKRQIDEAVEGREFVVCYPDYAEELGVPYDEREGMALVNPKDWVGAHTERMERKLREIVGNSPLLLDK